ncbi:Segregation and condensation protein A [uncultured Desulfatiglans sp.]|nr:Segregation and condensation protein A [uncultured Desulfatiglans sp.]
MDYEIKLEVFEGPLDLLLHLIHKNEVDIFDIPIAAITDQYLAYIDRMEELNVGLAGDFLVMAATLLHIKSRMLLPELRGEEDEEDPRVELTRPLLEYLSFKEAARSLFDREILERDVFVRRDFQELQELSGGVEPELEVSLFQLIQAFKRVADQRIPERQLQMQMDVWSVKDKIAHILDQLRGQGPLFFAELLGGGISRLECVVTFLALLQMVRLGLVRTFQPAAESDIQILPCPENTPRDIADD